MAVESTGGVLGRAYKKPPWNSRADYMSDAGKSMGPYPGVEIPVIPDEPGDSTAVMWWKGSG